MNILITGGGCEEPIDDVRSVCNFSTGKTSSLIADCLVKAYKLAEEIETEVDDAGNKDDKGE